LGTNSGYSFCTLFGCNSGSLCAVGVVGDYGGSDNNGAFYCCNFFKHGARLGSQMKLIVGLGNPGKKFEKTRHNVGFILLDKFAEEIGGGATAAAWSFDPKFVADIVKITKAGEEYLLVKPETFMNKSGESVSKVVNYFDIDLEEILVVHDDVDLQFGQTKLQTGRNSAGHKGVQSIIDTLKTNNFWRFRVGVGRPEDCGHDANIETDDWVLMNLTDKELSQIKAIKIPQIPTQIS